MSLSFEAEVMQVLRAAETAQSVRQIMFIGRFSVDPSKMLQKLEGRGLIIRERRPSPAGRAPENFWSINPDSPITAEDSRRLVMFETVMGGSDGKGAIAKSEAAWRAMEAIRGFDLVAAPHQK